MAIHLLQTEISNRNVIASGDAVYCRELLSATHLPFISIKRNMVNLSTGCLNAYGQVGGIVTYFKASFKVACLPMAGR